jgi:hypothetical protein
MLSKMTPPMVLLVQQQLNSGTLAKRVVLNAANWAISVAAGTAPEIVYVRLTRVM